MFSPSELSAFLTEYHYRIEHLVLDVRQAREHHIDWDVLKAAAAGALDADELDHRITVAAICEGWRWRLFGDAQPPAAWLRNHPLGRTWRAAHTWAWQGLTPGPPYVARHPDRCLEAHHWPGRDAWHRTGGPDVTLERAMQRILEVKRASDREQ